MSEAGADVVGQVGTNWVHTNGTDHDDIVRFTTEVSEKYETPILAADCTLYWAIYRTLGIGPVGSGNGSLLDSLRPPGGEPA